MIPRIASVVGFSSQSNLSCFANRLEAVCILGGKTKWMFDFEIFATLGRLSDQSIISKI